MRRTTGLDIELLNKLHTLWDDVRSKRNADANALWEEIQHYHKVENTCLFTPSTEFRHWTMLFFKVGLSWYSMPWVRAHKKGNSWEVEPLMWEGQTTNSWKMAAFYAEHGVWPQDIKERVG